MYKNGSGIIIRDSSDGNATECDNAVPDWSADGFRLPREVEWEIASRGAGLAVTDGTYGIEYSGSNTIEDVEWYRCLWCIVGLVPYRTRRELWKRR